MYFCSLRVCGCIDNSLQSSVTEANDNLHPLVEEDSIWWCNFTLSALWLSSNVSCLPGETNAIFPWKSALMQARYSSRGAWFAKLWISEPLQFFSNVASDLVLSVDGVLGVSSIWKMPWDSNWKSNWNVEKQILTIQIDPMYS